MQELPEFNATAFHLRHEQLGTQYFHVHRADTNNAFSIAFPTYPTASHGVPHILEHVVLCGSLRFPVRDPFFKMLTRSFASYMNAWTASDYTMYPVSTTNSTDMKHLRDIYFDAVFHPLIKEQDFRQEGWRVELADPKGRDWRTV